MKPLFTKSEFWEFRLTHRVQTHFVDVCPSQVCAPNFNFGTENNLQLPRTMYLFARSPALLITAARHYASVCKEPCITHYSCPALCISSQGALHYSLQLPSTMHQFARSPALLITAAQHYASVCKEPCITHCLGIWYFSSQRFVNIFPGLGQ